MRFSTLVTVAHLLAGGIGAWATDAPEIHDSPIGAYALADMPSGGNKNIYAQVYIGTADGGNGVSGVININGGDRQTGGPFLYHIHTNTIPDDGNCTAALAHLDPYGRGESPICDKNNPQSCQVGDLSGKWGACEDLPGCSVNFTDKYLSLSPSDPSYMGNRSFVIHYANKTRIACANFVVGNSSNPMSNDTTSVSMSTSTMTSTSTVPTGSSRSKPTGGSTTAPSNSASGIPKLSTTLYVALLMAAAAFAL